MTMIKLKRAYQAATGFVYASHDAARNGAVALKAFPRSAAMSAWRAAVQFALAGRTLLRGDP